MYVRTPARKASVGRRLVEAVCNLARQQVELIQLTVVRDNEQARSLYARLGFPEYGMEKNALKQDGRYYDEGAPVRPPACHAATAVPERLPCEGPRSLRC